MTQWLSFRKPAQEYYEGRKIMTDPGVHQAVEAEIRTFLQPGAAILEIGTGQGAFAFRMHNSGYDVSAVDISDEHVDAPGVRFRKIGIHDHLPTVFGPQRFQAVVAIEVVEHVRSTWKFFQEAADLLEAGGRLFLTTPNLSSFYGRIVFLKQGRFFHFQGEDSWQMGHINPVPFFVAEQVATECGFRLISRQGIGYMPVIDWSGFKLRQCVTALPRLLLYLLMNGPGPKDGNILFYSFEKVG